MAPLRAWLPIVPKILRGPPGSRHGAVSSDRKTGNLPDHSPFARRRDARRSAPERVARTERDALLRVGNVSRARLLLVMRPRQRYNVTDRFVRKRLESYEPVGYMSRGMEAKGMAKASNRRNKPAPPRKLAGDKVFEIAAELFYRRGIRAVGVEEIVKQAGVAKISLYRNFPSKDDLVVAYLERRNADFWHNWDETFGEYAGDPSAQLNAIMSYLAHRTTQPGYGGCPFLNFCAEFRDATHPGRRVARCDGASCGLRTPWRFLIPGNWPTAFCCWSKGLMRSARPSGAVRKALANHWCNPPRRSSSSTEDGVELPLSKRPRRHVTRGM